MPKLEAPHLGVDESRMYDDRLKGVYDLHDVAHAPGSGRRQSVDVPGSARSGRIGAKLQPSLTISENSSEVFSVRFSPDGKFLAAGCGDGAVRVFNVDTGKLVYNLQHGSSLNLPCTSLRFRPSTAASKTRNVLVVVNANGSIQHWHMTSGKCLSTIETEDQIYAMDYRNDGAIFGVAGKDHCIRIYDETTKQEALCLRGGTGYGSSATPGHSNRVFSVKFNPRDPEVLLSGGWDNTVQIWDMRVGHSVRSIFGPHLSGDALDISGNEVLTGSWRPNNPLELWDFGSGELIESIPWSASGGRSQPTLLYSCQFSPSVEGKQYIGAGGSGSNKAKIFDYNNNNALVGTISGMARGVFSLDFSPDPEDKKVAVGCGDASIMIIDILEDMD